MAPVASVAGKYNNWSWVTQQGSDTDLFITSVSFYGVVARNHFEIGHVSRLDIPLGEFDDIRVAATRSRHERVCNGVVLPAEHRSSRINSNPQWLQADALISIAVTFFLRFSAFCKNHSERL